MLLLVTTALIAPLASAASATPRALADAFSYTSSTTSYDDVDAGASDSGNDPLLAISSVGCGAWCNVHKNMCVYDPCLSCERDPDSVCYVDEEAAADDEELANQKAGMMAGCSAWCKRAICKHEECSECPESICPSVTFQCAAWWYADSPRRLRAARPCHASARSLLACSLYAIALPAHSCGATPSTTPRVPVQLAHDLRTRRVRRMPGGALP